MISKLKVDSTEYDSKIKRATQGLLAMEDACRKVGGTLSILEEDERKFVQGLGQMETVSRSARGRLSELTQAYTDLSVQYKRLTDEEKKGDFGKALSSSLEQLKGRIGEAKQQLKDVDKELGNDKKSGIEMSGVLDALAGKFGMSTKALGVWGVALGAATTAMKVAKDAFFASEQNIDDWGKSMEGAQSVYEGFLQSLNSGNFTSFLSNMTNIAQAAREAYDAIDALQTLQIMNSKKVGGQMTENERMRTMLRTGRYVAPLDGRKGTMAEGTVLTKEQKEAIARQLQNGMKTLITYQKEELGANTTAVNKKIAEIASTLGTTATEFEKVTADDATLKKYREGYKAWLKFEQENTSQGYTINGTYVKGTRNDKVNPYAAYGAYGWTTQFKEEGEAFQQVKTLRDQNQALQRDLISKQGQAYRAINTANKNGGGGGGGKSDSSNAAWAPIEMQSFDFSQIKMGRNKADVQANLRDAQKAYDDAMDEMGRAAAWKLVQKYQKELDKMEAEKDPFADFKKRLEIDSNTMQNEAAKLSVPEEKMSGRERLEKGIEGISKITGGLNQMGVKVPEEIEKAIAVMQGAMAVIQGVQTVMEVLGTTSMTANTIAINANTAALLALTASMEVNTATNLIPGFKNGGVVPRAATGMVIPGNDHADHTLLYASSGETILNKAQSNTIAGLLERGEQGGGYQGTPYVEGEKIFLGVNNFLRKSGKGEIVTSRK